MPGKATRGIFRGSILSGALSIGALLAMPLGLAGPAWGDDVYIQSETTRVPYRNNATNRPTETRRPDNSRHISPMGSATGAPPGYYQGLLGYNGPQLEYVPTLPPAVPIVYYVTEPIYQAPPPPEKQVVVVNQVTVNTPPPVIERIVERVREAPAPRPEPEAPRAPKPTAPQPVLFEILPADAQVKLDGRAIGSAAELGGRQEPLQLSPGVYILQVDRQGYKSQRLVFGVSAELVRVEVDLTSEEPSLRARVR